MEEKIKERIAAEEQDERLESLKELVVNHVKRSRGAMSEKYDRWDMHNDVYMGVRPLDKEDLEAAEHNEPEKMVVPMSFAQIQTFVAFCFLLFTQNRHFFEYVATGSEDYELVNDSEELLDRDLRRNDWLVMLYQLLLDTSRFGIGVVKHWWSVEKQNAPVSIAPSENSVNGFAFHTAGTTSQQSLVKFEGNRLSNISPYNFFPDTRFPLSEWKKGAFVADETEWHENQLREWERDGLVAGVQHIDDMSHDDWKHRDGKIRLPAFEKYMRDGKKEGDKIICVTECQLKLVPSKYDLGPEEYPVPYIVQVANDSRVIRAEPMGYMHDEWTYDVALFSPDMHQQIGESLSDVIASLQDVVSYLINSRLMSVRRSLDNNLIIDPSGVDMTTVESRSPWILMKKGSPRLGVDKFVRQLNYVDTTANHLADADLIMKIMQTVTGVNENSMGQFTGGRRSATEARAVNSGAASRMKVTASLIWSSCVASLGRKMLTNLRQGISAESYVKVLGETALVRYDRFHPSDPSRLVGVEDHFVFDGTLQSEKGFIAQSLQELVTAMFSNPLVMQVLPIDIGKLMEEILQLRGVDNIERFRTQPQLPNGQPTGTIPGIGQNGAAGVPPFGPGIPQI